MPFATYPPNLENKAWQKAKSVFAGKTGVGEKLEELKEAHEAVVGSAFDGNGLKSKNELDEYRKSVDPEVVKAKKFSDLLIEFAKFAQTKAGELKKAKTCPSKTREYVEKMSSTAHKTAVDTLKFLKEIDGKIKNAEKTYGEEDVKDDDLLGQLKAAKSSQRNFVLAWGKVPGLVISKSGITSTHRQSAKELAGGSGKLIEGTVTYENSIHVFTLDVKPVNGLARALKKAITIQTKTPMKVIVRGLGVEMNDDNDTGPEEGTTTSGPTNTPQTNVPPQPNTTSTVQKQPTNTPQTNSPPQSNPTTAQTTAPTTPDDLSPNQQNLFKLPFNHGNMDRNAAETLLAGFPAGSWLIRFSPTQKQSVVSCKLPDGKFTHFLSMPSGKDLTMSELVSNYKLDSHKVVKPGDKAPNQPLPTSPPTQPVDPALKNARAKVQQLINACAKSVPELFPPFDKAVLVIEGNMKQTLLKLDPVEILSDFEKGKKQYLEMLHRAAHTPPPPLTGKKLATKNQLKKDIFLAKSKKGKNTTPFKLASDQTYINELAMIHGLSVTEVKEVLKTLMKELDVETRELLPPGFNRPHGEKNTINPLVPEQSRPKLTLDEAQAVLTYSSNDYQDINPPLWGGKVPNPPHDKTHKFMQDAFAKCKPFDTPVTVTRGLSFDPGPPTDNFLKKFKDAAGTDTLVPLTGYISTGTAGTPPTFKGNIEFVILAKQALDLQPYSFYPKEKELLINHNTPVKVHSCKQTGNKWVVTVEQILPITN